MKKTLIILGMGVAVGAVTYAFLHSIKRKRSTKIFNQDSKPEEIPSSNSICAPTLGTFVNDVDFARKTAVASITERHKEAAQIIKKTVEEIYKTVDSAENGLSDLDQIASELDDLLKED